MAGTGMNAVHQKRRVYVFFLVSLLLFTLCVLLMMRILHGKTHIVQRKASRQANPYTPKALSNSHAGLKPALRRLRALPDMEVEGYDTDPVPTIRVLAVQKTVVRHLKHFLGHRDTKLEQWQMRKGSPYPLKVRVLLASSPLEIRLRWRGGGSSPREHIPFQDVPVPEYRQLPTRKTPDGKKRRTARIAIVLDDAGDSNQLQWLFLRLRTKLTFAVLPGLAYSHEFATRAKVAGQEVILHAPMMPRSADEGIIPAQILAPGMDRRSVRQMLEGFFRRVPHARGMNNHMGSLATADQALMNHVMAWLQPRKLFFLDSRTHAATVALATARRMHVPCVERDVFLDHEHDYEYIRSRLYHLARLAARRGRAVGIGHVTRLTTYQVLRDHLPRLKRLGFQFVFASEMAE